MFFAAFTSAIGQKAGFFKHFSGVEWLVMTGCGSFHVLSQIFNFKAGQNLPLPARLPLNVTSVIYQILIDVVLFSLEFSTVQIVLIIAIVLVKIFELSFFYCVEIPKMQAVQAN